MVGYDHRQYGSISSKHLARTTAAVFLSQGFRVYMLEDFVCTPFVPFAITHFECCAGVMVTASHNPKQDNGFKVYWSNGAQIIPPHDANISAAIEANLEPWQLYDIGAVVEDGNACDVTDIVAEAYFEQITKMCLRKAKNPKSPLRVAYTGIPT